MVEYHACAATVNTLYALGIPGKTEEFAAYRLLDYLHGRNHRGTLFPWLFRAQSC